MKPLKRFTKNIVLTGLMASGKTSVGKMLARRLAFRFIDTDRLVEKEAGMKVRSIFQRYGEPYFRGLEKKACLRVREYCRHVISTGGGAVLDAGNRKALRKNGIIINLRADPKVLWKRVKGKSTRPLLLDADPLKKLRTLWKVRKKYYDKAHLILRTDRLTKGEVVKKILDYLRS
jgi:shikimate kinase